jgi:hypothetical protein
MGSRIEWLSKLLSGSAALKNKVATEEQSMELTNLLRGWDGEPRHS